MSTIYIAGIAMTVFGRHLERSLEDMAREALQGALKDAGCKHLATSAPPTTPASPMARCRGNSPSPARS